MESLIPRGGIAAEDDWERTILDTVLGLSMTSTAVGWVLVDGRADAGPTVSGNEFAIPGDCGASNASGSSAAAAAAMDVVARVQAMLAGRGERLRGIGVTWSGDATAASALLLESLVGAQADNVVPVRFSQAAESLAGDTDPADGSGRIAVCVVEPALATLVVFGGDDDPVVTECAITGGADVTGWLTELLGSGGRRPAMLMLAGSGSGLDKLGRRLETRLSVPVFVQAGAPLALARGAALALGAHADLGGEYWEGASAGPGLGSEMDPAPARSASYAGGLAMLAGGAVAFVVSLSAALSLQWGPGDDAPQPDHVSVARVAVPAPIEAPAAPPAEISPPPEELPAQPPAETPDQAPVLPQSPAPFGGLQDAPPAPNPVLVPGPAPQPSGPRSLLDRVRQHVPHLAGR